MVSETEHGADLSHINSVVDLVNQAIATHAMYQTRVWWRGEPALADPKTNRTWKLAPGVYRVTNGGVRYEQNIFRLFRQRAQTRHSNCPSDTDSAAWLFFAQHYRLATRMLDWTESALFATYFAVREYPEQTASVYALSPYLLNHYQITSDTLVEPHHEEARKVIGDAFSGATTSDKVVALAVPEVDIRMMAQHATVTAHGTPTPLDQLPNHDKFLTRFLIPAERKKIIQDQLEMLSVYKSNLFPDLDHLAEELNPMRFGSAAASALHLQALAEPAKPALEERTTATDGVSSTGPT